MMKCVYVCLLRFCLFCLPPMFSLSAGPSDDDDDDDDDDDCHGVGGDGIADEDGDDADGIGGIDDDEDGAQVPSLPWVWCPHL